jgi:hypothetical protein
VSKFTCKERLTIENIVTSLTIRRVSDSEIIEEIRRKTRKSISRQSLYNIRQRIKQDSYEWYQMLRQGNYEYIHEFKERINEIIDLQKKHHEIVDKHPDNPIIQQKSLEELHRLNITLSNYYDVAPQIVNFAYPKQNANFTDNNDSISIQQKDIIV